MMSANITAASTPCRRTGSSVTPRRARANDLEQPVALADLPVPGQGPPRLAHEPDRRALDGLEAAGSTRRGARHGGRLELRGELVVDPAEDERGDHERGGRDPDHVDHVAELGQLAPEQRVANRLHEGRHGVAVTRRKLPIVGWS